MRLLELTLDTPAANLALDEALLEHAERSVGDPYEVLRIWEPTETMVVCGRSSKIHEEVFQQACQQDGVPILRRCSGGASIVTGPGCLMYGLVLSYQRRPALRMIEQAHRFVLDSLAISLNYHVADVKRAGISDLATGSTLPQKFSGNSLRCRRTHLLYHGTLLYNYPLAQIGRYLTSPPRQPDYRLQRDHASFVSNLAVPRDAIRAALLNAWTLAGPLHPWPESLTDYLLFEKYSRDDWNLVGS